MTWDRFVLCISGAAKNCAGDDDGGELLFPITSPLHHLFSAGQIQTLSRSSRSFEESKDDDEDEEHVVMEIRGHDIWRWWATPSVCKKARMEWTDNEELWGIYIRGRGPCMVHTPFSWILYLNFGPHQTLISCLPPQLIFIINSFFFFLFLFH